MYQAAKEYRKLINVALLSEESVLQIGFAHALRALEGVNFIATIGSFQSLAEISLAFDIEVLIIFANMPGGIPEIFHQAENVICLGEQGELNGIAPQDLSLETLRSAIVKAAVGFQKTQFAAYVSEGTAIETKLISARSTLESKMFGPKQLEVIQLLVKGMTNAEIARVLNISLPTARYHVSEVFRKLSVSNRAEASAEIVRQNILKDDPQDVVVQK